MTQKLPKNQTITFKTDIKTLDRLTRLADKADIPRSKLVANIVEEISLTLDATNKIGILNLIIILRDMNDFLTGWVEKMKKKNDFVTGKIKHDEDS